MAIGVAEPIFIHKHTKGYMKAGYPDSTRWVKKFWYFVIFMKILTLS